MARWKVVGISFDHMHMGDLLRQVDLHPDAEIAGIWDPDPARMASAVTKFVIPPERVFTDLDACLSTGPDLAILCSATARHAEFVERIAPHVASIIVEKPFASSLVDADRMIAATGGKLLAVNWPLAWYPCHVTAQRLIAEGVIGPLQEVHYYDGNRGPLHHLADKIVREPTREDKANAWWYSAAAGGGSMLDYLGYGVTLGTWFMDGRAPEEVTTVLGGDPALEVDEHSVTIARYGRFLSRFETRWGTFTDPWVHQPQPKCGFVLVGQDGTISSYDYEDHVTVQTRANPAPTRYPVDVLPEGRRGPIEYVLSCLEEGQPVTGPLDPALCRIGQQIIETARLSARRRAGQELVT